VPDDSVAIVDAGPIGLAAVMTARLYTPGRIFALDVADARLEHALALGADVTINNGNTDAVAEVMELTGGLGADVAIEAVGISLRGARQARRPRCQRRRPWTPGDTALGEALDP